MVNRLTYQGRLDKHLQCLQHVLVDCITLDLVDVFIL